MKGAVYNNGILAGYLEQVAREGYVFTYEDGYFEDPAQPPISLTLPKSQRRYASTQLFAFFHGLLSEGINKDIQCRSLKIDERDSFKRLLSTTDGDSIGAITVKKIN